MKEKKIGLTTGQWIAVAAIIITLIGLEISRVSNREARAADMSKITTKVNQHDKDISNIQGDLKEIKNDIKELLRRK